MEAQVKRKSEAKDRAVIGDILSATTAEQRAWIGAVALAYNEMQRELHKLAGSCLGFIGIGPAYNVTSRINGTDGLLAIISGAVIAIEIPEEQAKLFNTALSGFGEGKTLRDSVEHVELSDTTTQTGIAPGKRGKGSIDVLLSPNALEGLYKRLVLVKKRNSMASKLFSVVQRRLNYSSCSARSTISGDYRTNEIFKRPVASENSVHLTRRHRRIRT
jgi:hypothetical protein